ncbi:sensor histidine kinase [Aureimonas psammosilenae]|uniref:sensor histidine kinase n=1 Tax=Aureimonas psammosilenae TaxID=2495496 RepID=UPI001F407F15|nr:PAS domain-containing sensor histidine kinase [Aureimonas psammosilenae]
METMDAGRSTAAKALAALGNTELTLFSQNFELAYDWIYNAGDSWLADAKVGQDDGDVLGDASSLRLVAIKREVLRSGKPAHFELSVMRGSTTKWFDVRVDVERNVDGMAIGLVGTSLDVTEQKRREETLKTLLRELSHRSKNLLAIIQSLASQTARHSVTVPEFLVRFRGRIQSLSSSQDIVTDTDWRGADLANLVRMQVERYAPDGMEQVSFRGPDVYLSPTASLHVGLALHELAVNAASYGSLSVPGGRVAINSSIEDEEGERVLCLEWQESGGPQVRGDHDPRFGTSTLERIVPNSVGGHARLTYRREGVHYRLSVPDLQFEELDAPTASA